MNKKIVFFFSFILMFSNSIYGVQKVEVYTYDTLPPLAFRDTTGTLTGIYIEIVKKAVSRMPDYEVVFKVVPWARAKQKVSDGSAFAILPPYFHAHDWLTAGSEKRPYIWPYSLPLFTQSDVVMCNSKINPTPEWKFPESYEGLTFAMWRGDGRAGGKFMDMVKNQKIRVVEVSDILRTVLFVLKERADCTVTSRMPFFWYLNRIKNSPKYNVISGNVQLIESSVISKNQGYLGYSDIDSDKNYPFKKDFSIKFDIEVYKMKKNNEIDSIVESFIGIQPWMLE
ncbi:transporter substrate-binding domain-containing protein [Vibrio profundum]|uniref:substrate-binding periplasmic protein n=1 Tax=Vibrio profundum TaxID=2910247 RepID=UPI003D0D1CBB